MSIFGKIREKLFINSTNIKVERTPKTEPKQDLGDLGNVLKPIFYEIPPDSKAGKYLEEGMRSWNYIAISSIADEVSTLDLDLYKRVKNGDTWEKVEEEEAPIILMNKPNPFQTKEEFLWLLTSFLLAEGEAPILLNSDKNPTSMILLNPQNLKIIFNEKDIIGKYKYRKTNGQEIDIDANRILFFKLPNWKSPFRGLGVSGFIKETLDLDYFIEQYLNLFFYNNATPAGVLSTEQKLTDETIKRLQIQFEQRHKGLKNAHKMAVLEQGLKWENIGSKLNEIGLKEREDAIRDKILAAYKVPKSILGLIEDVNRANGENSDRVFARRAVKPKVLIIQGQLNFSLLPKFDNFNDYWFEFENPVQDDELVKAQIREINIRSGVRTVNEYREEDGLEPTETSNDNTTDETSTNNNNSKRWYRINKFRIKSKSNLPAKEDGKKDIWKELAKEIIKTDNKEEIKKDFTDKDIAEFHDQKIFFSNLLEKGLTDKLSKYFIRLGNKINRQIKGEQKSELKAVDFDIDYEKEKEVMMGIVIPFLEEAIEKESQLAFALLGTSGKLEIQSEKVRRFIKNTTLKMGKSATETTKDDVKRILDNWASREDGSIGELKNELTQYFGESGKKRSEAIARTEISRANGFSQTEVYKEVGAVGKKWITASDERVCEFCSQMDQVIVEVEQNFWDKGDTMIGDKGGSLDFGFGGVVAEPLHVNCRCDIVPVFSERRDYWCEHKEKNETRKKFYAEKELVEKTKQEMKKKEMGLFKKEKELEENILEFEELKKINSKESGN